MSGIKNKLIKGTAWLSISRLIINSLAMLSTIVLARLLSPADFGLIAVATTMLLVITEVTELSLSAALIRHTAPLQSHFDAAWTLNAVRGVVLGGLFALAGWPVASIYKEPRLVLVMIALGFSVFLSGLVNPRRIMLQRDLIFWQEFVLNVAQKLVGVVVSVAVAYFYKSYWALVVGTLASQATNVIISYTVVPFRPRITFAHTKELLSFSVWLTAIQIVNTLNWRFDYLFIGKMLGNSALGFYSVGSNLASMPTRETTAPLKQTFFPGFSSIRDDRVRLAAGYQRAQAFVTAVALPAGISAALIADPLIRLTMGEKWEPVIFIMQTLAAVYALQTLGSLVDSLGMAQGKTRLLFKRSLQMLLIRIPVIAAALWFYGLPGVILARVCTGLFSTWMNMDMVRRFTGLSVLQQLSSNVRSLTSVGVMAVGVILANRGFTNALDTQSLLIKIGSIMGLAALHYCGMTVLLWVLMRKPMGPEQEVYQLMGKLFRKVCGG